MEKSTKITKSDLAKLIKEEIAKVEMNKNDNKKNHSEKALTYKNTEETKEKKGVEAADVNMNQNDKSLGSDIKAATAVEVKAGGEVKKDGATTGMHKADFKSKTENPSVKSSDPFKDKFDGKMNSMDKADKSGAKTFVDAGKEKGGDSATAGQHKAEYAEKAPKVKDQEPIATGIQLKELKDKYSATELKSFIIKESEKLAKKMYLEAELQKLQSEMDSLDSQVV